MEQPRPGDPLEAVPGSRVEAVLKSDRYALTCRVRLGDGRPAIYKLSRVLVPPGLRFGAAARHLTGREAGHLEALAGIPGVPALLGRPTPDALLRQWLDGSDVRQLDAVPDAVFPRLRALLGAVHERGVAYADLAKEDNIVVEDGTDQPWLVDFQISVGRGTLLGPLVPYLQTIDRYHLAKHVRTRRPDQLDDEDRAALKRGKGALKRLHRLLLKKPYNLLTRRIVRRWSGAGEGRRADDPRHVPSTESEPTA